MAKASTSISVKESKQTELKTRGILCVGEDNKIYIDTEDFGAIDVLAVVNELGLQNVEVELKITAKNEAIDELDPLAID